MTTDINIHTGGGSITITGDDGSSVNVTTQQLTFNIEGGGAPTSFTSLTDTPSNYTSQAGKLLRINSGETGVEFIDPEVIEDINWGEITGTLSDQTDLQDALDLKYDAADYNSDFDTRLATKTTTDLTEGTNLYYTDTRVSANTDVLANTLARHDAVTVTDSSEIDFTLTGQDLTASIKAGSIDESKLDTSVNASLDLADSSLQSETDTLQSVTDRGATTTTESTFSGGLITNQVKANSSAGIALQSNNGTAVAEFGAGGAGNWTFEDGVKFNSLTGSKLLFTDANKNITTTGIGTSSQFLKADGSVDSNTYLTSLSGLDTDDLSEGSTNQYFTNARAISALTGQNVSIFTNDAGYLTSYTETQNLDDVTTLGNTTTNSITTGGLTLNSGNINLNGNYLSGDGGNEGIYVDSSGNVGIGTTAPSARLHTISTTEQLRVGYDTSNYFNATVASNGATTFNAVGSGANFIFSDPVNVSGNITSNSFIKSGATSDDVLLGDGSTTSLTGIQTSPAGSDTQVQFNDGGSFGASSDFTFDKNTKKLTVGTKSTSGGDVNFHSSDPFGAGGTYEPNFIFDTNFLNFGFGAGSDFFGATIGNTAIGLTNLPGGVKAISSSGGAISIGGQITNNGGGGEILIGFDSTSFNSTSSVNIGRESSLSSSENSINIGENNIVNNSSSSVTLGRFIQNNAIQSIVLGGGTSNLERVSYTKTRGVLFAFNFGTQNNLLEAEYNKGVRIGAISGETVTMDGDDLYVAGHIEAGGGYYSSDGTGGATEDVATLAPDGTTTRTLHYKNGLYTGYTDS